MVQVTIGDVLGIIFVGVPAVAVSILFICIVVVLTIAAISTIFRNLW